jgi:hypothetical protein
MKTNTAGQEWIVDVNASDAALLADALQDALDAKREGRIIGPIVDQVALRRARRRAFNADLAREMRTASVDGVA